MKKYLIASLAASALMASSVAFAANNNNDLNDIQLTANAIVTVIAPAAAVNIPSIGTFLPVAARAGFVKNPFDFVISANNAVLVQDNAATSAFGVAVGSNKGYGVYTGSSLGGSVAQCGTLVAKGTANLAASLVENATLVLANANGCGRAL